MHLLQTFFEREKLRMIIVLVKSASKDLSDLATTIQSKVTPESRDLILMKYYSKVKEEFFKNYKA